jgi:hypothetical protein
MNFSRHNMPRHRWSVAFIAAFVLVAGAATAGWTSGYGPIPSYYDQLQYHLTSPGARATSISGYANPAFYDMMPGSELNYSWTGKDGLKNWGLFLGGPNIGFGVVRNDLLVGDGVYAGVYDYRLALSTGTKDATVGLSFGWSGGDKDLVARSQLIQVGAAQRISRYVSLGLVGNFATQASYQSGLVDLAVRPMGTSLLTLFADYELPKGIAASDAPWSVGAMVDAGPGLQLTGRYFESKEWSIGVGYALDVLGFTAAPRFNENDKNDRTVYQIRAGYAQRDILSEKVQEEKNYVSMNLKGPVSYRAYEYFDNRHPLSRIRCPDLARQGLGDPREVRRSPGGGQTRGHLRRQPRNEGISPREHRRQNRHGSRGYGHAPRLRDGPHVCLQYDGQARHRSRRVAVLQVQVGRRGALARNHVGGRQGTAARDHRGHVPNGARRSHLVAE